jgi:hypothetical protein
MTLAGIMMLLAAASMVFVQYKRHGETVTAIRGGGH